MSSSSFSPVAQRDRILSIDLLRGVAVLGILIMNVQHFSMPQAAYINPTAYGDLQGLNLWVWILSHLLASEKFMSVFSMLFGAGVLLFTERAEQKGMNSASLHYRRMGWLLVFGLLHAYLLWSGDILVSYSLCGMLVFLFRKKKPFTLVGIGFAFFLVPILLNLFFAWSIPYWPEENMQYTMDSWMPSREMIQHHLEVYRSGWWDQMELRIPGSIFMQTGYFFMESFWQVTALMLLGMALYKWKIPSCERSPEFYGRMALIGLLSGYLLSSLGIYLNFKNQWAMEYSMFLGSGFNYVGSVGVALGYTALVMIFSKSAGFTRIKGVLSAVGRMAFTNYILMTLLGTFIFYGHGLGVYGSVERKFQILVVLAIWIPLLVISPIWLKRFRFGPLEGIWRMLTYRRYSIKSVCLLPAILLFMLVGCHPESGKRTSVEEGDFSFAFLTDIHLQPERGAAIGFQWAIREVNKRNPDFVLTGGDMIMDALNQTYGRADSLYKLYDELSDKFNMPVYHTIGNHEVYAWQRMEKGIEQHPEFGKGMYERRLGPRYYTFDHKGWHFMVLDAVYLEERGSYTGKIDEEQIEWIKKDLEQLDMHTPIAISVHFPFVSTAFQITMGPRAKVPDGLIIENSREVLALFSDHNLKLVLQGHLHFLESMYVQNQVHFITGGAVSGKWWNNDPESRPEEGFVMVHIRGQDLSWEYVDYGWTPRGDL